MTIARSRSSELETWNDIVVDLGFDHVDVGRLGRVGKMEITEIRIKLMESSEDRLRAFCSITIDGAFVVRDLKIIDGTSGPFVAMPSRKLTGHCHRCNHKNHLRAAYCNHCGAKLRFDSGGDLDSPQKLYADVAHPINSECRELIQNAVISGFEAELARSNEPGYRSRYDDDFDAGEDHVLDQDVYIDKGSPRKAAGNVPKPKYQKRDEPDAEDAKVEALPKEDDGFGAGIF